MIFLFHVYLTPLLRFSIVLRQNLEIAALIWPHWLPRTVLVYETGNVIPFFFSGWHLFRLSYSVLDLGRGCCILCLSLLRTALLLLPFFFFSRTLYFRLSIFWSKQYLSLSYRENEYVQLKLHYIMRYSSIISKNVSTCAAPRGYSPLLSLLILSCSERNWLSLLTQIRDIMLWLFWYPSQHSPLPPLDQRVWSLSSLFPRHLHDIPRPVAIISVLLCILSFFSLLPAIMDHTPGWGPAPTLY